MTTGRVLTGGPGRGTVSGTLTSRPAAAAFGIGEYLASDENGGTLYHSDASTWVQVAAGVSWPSGQMVVGPVQLTAQFDVKAVSNTVTDVTGMSIAVPASATRPILVKGKFEAQANTGTATSGSNVLLQAFITNSSNTILAADAFQILQGATSGVICQGSINLELYLPAPVSAATYKVRARCGVAPPANWTSVLLLPGLGVTTGQTNNFYAITV